MGGDRSRWLASVLAGVLVLSGLAACQDDDDAGDTSTTSEASTATTSETTTTTAEPARTQDQAIAAWVETEGTGPYLGPCPVDFDAEFPLDGLCSVPWADAPDGSVQGLGPPFSEITVFLLLDVGTDGWIVRETYSPAEPYDLSDAPDWLPEEPIG